LHGFEQRIQKMQPIVAPNDVRRYFVTPQESGELCLLSCIFGGNRDIFFPKMSEELHLITFSEIAIRYLEQKGYTSHLCENEVEARTLMKTLPEKGIWPCLFSASDTTGEKDFEEFFTNQEITDLNKFQNLGAIKNSFVNNDEKLKHFESVIEAMHAKGIFTKEEIVALFHEMIPNFGHEEKGKNLDNKM